MTRGILCGLSLASLIACARDEPTATSMSRDLTSSEQLVNERDDGDGGGRLQSDEVEAHAAFTGWRGKRRQCQGTDGLYTELIYTLTGTVAGDPRLEGSIEISGKTLINETENLGPDWGSMVIRNAVTAEKKAFGDYNSWGDITSLQGAVAGRVLDDGAGAEPTSGDGRWIANWRQDWTKFPVVTMQFGGASAETRLRAGVWSGRCTGPYESFDIELGGTSTLARSASTGRLPRVR
jgi:hypothetical protein